VIDKKFKTFSDDEKEDSFTINRVERRTLSIKVNHNKSIIIYIDIFEKKNNEKKDKERLSVLDSIEIFNKITKRRMRIKPK
jgi:hypothetical protein